eukprot:NODE_10958_length_1317_cov_8.205042.p3 GENE.NODE_10958_length_1317_cov_8.205042~~NODE_10958_length_1317_cov_8.205042.p3  ORF type:complete len:65 (-),score=12.17 NODE_10958_length_1317_cov_8.205042:234-428(-)
MVEDLLQFCRCCQPAQVPVPPSLRAMLELQGNVGHLRREAQDAMDVMWSQREKKGGDGSERWQR